MKRVLQRVAVLLASAVMLSGTMSVYPVYAQEAAELSLLDETQEAEDELPVLEESKESEGNLSVLKETSGGNGELTVLNGTETATGEISDSGKTETAENQFIINQVESPAEEVTIFEQLVYSSSDGAAPEFSLPTLTGETITQNTYASKTQLLVFYRGNGKCYNSNNTIKSIASSYWVSNDAIQVIAIEADDQTKATVASYKEDWAPDANIVWAYDGNRTMWNYVRKVRGSSNLSITYAVCAIVQDGKIAELWDGCSSASECEEELRKHVDIGSDPSIETVKVSGTYNGTMARSMFDDVNSFRTGAGVWQWNSDNSTKKYFNTDGTTQLKALQYDYDLEEAAMERAKELAVMYSHTRPNNKPCTSITRRNNNRCGENIAYGYYTADSVLEAWIEEDEDYNGQGHRRNILNGGFTTIGIGCFYADGIFYWVQEFGDVNSGPSATAVNNNQVIETVEYSSDVVNISQKYMHVIFDGNGGSPIRSSRSYNLNSSFGSFPSASRNAYELTGWYTSPTGGTRLSQDAVADTIGDLTVYAQWELSPVGEFVTRLYEVGLDRTPEESGLNDWTGKLTSGRANAVNVVQGVLCSPEYLGKGKTNGDVVKDCYNAMLGRNPDTDGYNNWVSGLDAGMSVNAIFAGFVGSQEFANLCSGYGINPGTYPISEERDRNAGVTKFVSRLYTEALGRGYDIDGLNDWCGRINANPDKDNIMNVATNGFFHSAEFMGKELNNTEFVKVLYRTFLGREYDDAGLSDWVGQLDRGEKTRDEVMEGFAYSQEFENIMASYGL